MIKLIQCHCFLVNNHLESLGITQEGDDLARVSFWASDVYSIREYKDDSGEIIDKECVVYFRSGTSLNIDMSYDQAIKEIFNQ